MAATSFLSLFSGCGGLDIGLESLGWRCVAQVENDKDCVALLEQRFPGIPNLGDVTEADWSQVPPIDALVGGFPCQDLSYAGRGAGLAGDRSGLYYDMIEAIRQIRPRLVLIENVPGLLGRGLHVVTHDLARAGYAGTWRTLAAADIGAPHRRERVFVIARLERAEVDVVGSPIRIGNFAEDGWESPQTTLLGVELLDRMPKAGAWTGGYVYEFELEEGDDEILLLPTPAASESTPTEEYIEEKLAAGIKPDARLYMPGRKSFTQRTLSRIVPTLLPTPNAWLGRRPENSMADPERAKSREHEGERGKRSIELPDAIAAGVKLLPTPTTQDGENCAGPSQHDRNTPPLNVEVTKLLPTAVASDAASGGSRNLEGSKAHAGVSLTDAILYGNSETPRLLPTPVANPENPGAGGELRAAIHHGPERRTDSDTDTFGRPIRKGRDLLPTPQASDGSGGRLDRDPETLATRKRPSGTKASVPLATAIDRDDVAVEWGEYEPAILRWEGVVGRPAPRPTDEKGRLAPAFVEWMLGFPEGWVEIPGARRTAQLRMLGNSVQVQVAQVVGLWLSELGGAS